MMVLARNCGGFTRKRGGLTRNREGLTGRCPPNVLYMGHLGNSHGNYTWSVSPDKYIKINKMSSPELEWFLRVKREEDDPEKKQYYFKAQVQYKNDGGFNNSMNDTSIGNETAYMTGDHITKFTGVFSMDQSCRKGVDCFMVRLDKGFDPNLVRLAYVSTPGFDFYKFGALLYLVCAFRWPVDLFEHGERKDMMKKIGIREKKYEGMFIGYLLGYRMDDVMAWALNNESLVLDKQGFEATKKRIKTMFERWVTTAMGLDALSELADELSIAKADFDVLFPHVNRYSVDSNSNTNSNANSNAKNNNSQNSNAKNNNSQNNNSRNNNTNSNAKNNNARNVGTIKTSTGVGGGRRKATS